MTEGIKYTTSKGKLRIYDPNQKFQFDGEIIVKYTTEEEIEISTPTIDYMGSTCKNHYYLGSKYRSYNILGLETPPDGAWQVVYQDPDKIILCLEEG